MPRWIASMTKAWRLPSRLSRMTARQMTRRRCLGAGRSGLWVRGGNGALDGAEKEFGEQGGDEIGQDPCSGQPWVLGWGMSHGEGRFAVSYTHLRAHETGRNLVCRLLL